MAEIIDLRPRQPEEGVPDDIKVGDHLFRCSRCGGWSLYAILIEGRSHLRCAGCGEDHTMAVWGE